MPFRSRLITDIRYQPETDHTNAALKTKLVKDLGSDLEPGIFLRF